MVDFTELLKGTMIATAKRPETLPPGLYHGVIQRHELGDKNQNHTPYVRYHLALTNWPDSLPEDERPSDIDLSTRKIHRDFFITKDAVWRLATLLQSLGIKADGMNDDELVSAPVGHNVIVEVQKVPSTKDPNEFFNQVGTLTGAP